MKFQCEAGGIDFIDQASLQFVNTVELTAEPADRRPENPAEVFFRVTADARLLA